MKTLTRQIFFLFIFLNAINLCFAEPQPSSAIAKNGILDLRDQNLFSAPVALNGQWQFFWKELISPKDLDISCHKFVNFPSLWKNDTVNGGPISSQGFASYKLMILLPKQRPQLALNMPDVYSSYSLYINGVLVSRNGQPGKTKAETIPFWNSRVIYFSTQTDTLFILLQVANFHHAKGGAYKEILLGDRDQIYLNKEINSAYDWSLAGCLFMGGLFFLGLYLFGRHDKTILYFSLFCIVYSYRMIGTDDYVLHTIFPNINWFVSIRLEYLTLTLSTALFVRYTKNLYPADSNKIIMIAAESFCLLYAAIILLTPTIIFTALINIFLGCMFLCLAYAIFIYFQAAKNKRAGSIYALGSTAIMLIIFLLINLRYFEVLPAMKTVVFGGYIAFFFLQSLALSHRFARSFKLAAIQAQQGLKAKTEFLSTMSHEIRTPLNAVIGMTHLLLNNQPRNEQKKDLDIILSSAHNLLAIVNNILDYNSIEEGKISFENIPMDITEIANNIITSLELTAKEKGIDLKAEIDKRLYKKLTGDPVRTSQVLSNLIQNAVKFTEKGFVRLSINVSNINNDNVTLEILVKDSGIGIDPEKQKMIFDRFTQADSSKSRRFGGTGLGLAISKKILQLQGVDLQVKSEFGKGSVFYFTQTFELCAEQKTVQSIESSYNEDLSFDGMSILLVEDNQLNVMVAQTILENNGARVDVAYNGQEAIDKLDTSRHQIILMDLNMPVMDGYEATMQLRKRGETLPIIALTASTQKEVESEIYAAGIDDILVKPFNPEDLFRIISHYVHAVNT
ncbi:MAG TPA: response regulator [Puia sp.]|jgi:signal transduction histidine kinase/ActR/RegA family two-component response regulator|nr:response regulator [Puia sp.]